MKTFRLHAHLPDSKKVALLVKRKAVPACIPAQLRRQGHTWTQILRSITIPAVKGTHIQA
jgi:hypothetical protein